MNRVLPLFDAVLTWAGLRSQLLLDFSWSTIQRARRIHLGKVCQQCFLWMKSGAYAPAFETRIRKYLSKNKRRSEEQIHFTAFQAFQSGVYLGVCTLWECPVGFCLNGYTWELKGKRHQNCERLYWLSAIMLFLTERE